MGKPYIRYSGGGIWGTDEVNGVNVARGGGGLMEVIGVRLGGGISIEWGGCKLYSKGGKGTLTYLRY